MSELHPRIGALQIAIIVLTLATAFIHLFLGFSFLGSGPSLLPILFLLNGIGYLGLLGLLYLPISAAAPYRNIARWALMVFAAVTIVAFLLVGLQGAGTLAYSTKIIEVVLIVLLFMEGRQVQPAIAR
jgi:hypothetical protein